MKTLYTKNLIPHSVLDGLTLLGKLGVMEKDTWFQYFSSGKINWKNKQLKKLLDTQLLAKYPSHSIKDQLVVGKQGVQILKKKNYPYVTPPYLGQVDHDSNLSKIILNLNKNFDVHNFWVEKEIKSFGRDYTFFYASKDDQKFSDAIFNINWQKKPFRLALEYERTGKSIERCQSILKSYSCLDKIDYVLFVVENLTIRERFLEILKRGSYPLIASRIGFVLMEDVLNNFRNAQLITLRGPRDFDFIIESSMKLPKTA